MFYGHAMLIGDKESPPERIEMFILSGLSLSRPVDTKTLFNLNNIIATLVFNFYFFGKKIRRQMSSNLVSTPLDECQSWWASTLGAMRPLRATIGPLQNNWPLFHYVIGISGILPYNRNVTLQALKLFSVLSHGSIMLPPRQPRVFARLVRWQ